MSYLNQIQIQRFNDKSPSTNMAWHLTGMGGTNFTNNYGEIRLPKVL